MKPILLIIDGMDRTGKTTLINYINKQTNFTPLIMDRGPIGYKTYSELYNKKIKPSEYNILEQQLLKVNHLCIYLYTNEATIKQRCIDTNEKIPKRGIKKNLQVYNKYYKQSKLRKICFNTKYNLPITIYKYILEVLNNDSVSRRNKI